MQEAQNKVPVIAIMLREVILTILFAALIPGAANGYYGFSGDPARMDEWIESTIVPINPYMFQMRQPDGVTRIFQRDPDQPEVLVGDDPWVGEIRGTQTVVMTKPGFKQGQTGFLFERGNLKMMILNGKEHKIAGGKPACNGVENLWPKISENMIKEATERHRIHWTGRLSLWYANPNHAAMLLVEVLLLLFAAYGIKGLKPLKFAVAVLLLLCFYGLVRTESRGGIVSLIAGLSCYAVFRFKKVFTVKSMLLVAAAVAVFAAMAFLGGVGERFTTGLVKEGYTDTSRIPIWIEAPRMIVSAPWGWGWAKSGDAYINWFQPLNRFHVPGGFLNTHLNVLVDSGWIGRVCYCFAWAAILFWFANCAWRGRSVLPISMCAAVFVGCIFNPVGHALTLWVIPVAVVISFVVCTKAWSHGRGLLFSAIAAAVATGAVLAGFVCFGVRGGSDGIKICGNSSATIVNGSNADIWIVNDGQVLDGGYKGVLGKDVRKWFGAHRDADPVGFAETLKDVPKHAKRLVLAGKVCSEMLKEDASLFSHLPNLKEIVLISPPFGWQALPARWKDSYQLKVVVGSFAYKCGGGSGQGSEWVKVVPGCELYIPNWLRFVTN